MPKISRMYFRAAAAFLLAGIGIGLLMSISRNFDVASAHAHVGLLGWATPALFGTYFALAPERADTKLALAQYWIIVGSAAVMAVALTLLLLGYAGAEPVVAVASMAYALGAVLFAWIVFAPTHGVARSHGQFVS